jgi:hypothetical protein
MSLLRNTLRRLRGGVPKMDFMKNKHDNGTCRVFHFTNLDPKGSACPHFKAKKMADAQTADTTKIN